MANFPDGWDWLTNATQIPNIHSTGTGAGSVVCPSKGYLRAVTILPTAAIAGSGSDGCTFDINKNGVDSGADIHLPEGLAAYAGKTLYLENTQLVEVNAGDKLELSSNMEQDLSCNLYVSYGVEAT